MQEGVPYGSLDYESAKLLAKKIFDTYDKDKSGVIEAYEISDMMVDTYRSINKLFNPSQYDVDTYIKIMDKNQDGKVTLEDVEAMVIKLMCIEK